MFTIEALTALVYLTPGIIAAAFYGALVHRRERRDLWFLTEAFVFSIVVYAVYSALGGTGPLRDGRLDRTGVPSFEGQALLELVGLAVLIASLLGWSVTHDFHMRVARKLRLTKRTSRLSVWEDVFTDLGKRFVTVNLKNGRRINGWPSYYSDDPQGAYLFLSYPRWIKGGRFVRIDADGILITPSQVIESIEFLRQP